MKKTLIIITVIVLFSCTKDDKVTCTRCRSEQTPSFELCKESNGNASVNGEDTGINYEVYLADLQETEVSCGG